jgi:hypothetical protein
MAEAYDRFDPSPSGLVQLAKNQWWRPAGAGRQPDIDRKTALQHVEKHPWPKVVAAYVLARRADSPHDYAHAILERDFQPPQTTQSNGTARNHTDDDPKQRPAEARQRIGSAIDDARPMDG